MDLTQPHPTRLPTLAEIQENRVKIADLESRIADLAAQMNVLQRDCDNRKSFISPFRRLNTDVLRLIVQHSVIQGQRPDNLNRICRIMRETVNGMKALWSSIDFYGKNDTVPVYWEDDENPVNCQGLVFFEALLARAAPASLSITMNSMEAACEASSLLVSYSKYVHGYSLRRLRGGDDPPLPKETHFPNLKVLKVEGYAGDNVISLMDIANLSRQDTLSLEMEIELEIELDDIVTHPLFQRISNLNLSILTELHWGTPMITLPLLEKLTLSVESILQYIVAPKLRHIVLKEQDVTASRVPSIIDTLHLEDCTVLGEPSGQPTIMINLIHLTIIKTSFESPFDSYFQIPKLEELALSEPREFIDQDPLPVLNAATFGPIPSLKRLWIDRIEAEIGADFFTFPNLEALRITQRDIQGIAESSIASMPQLEEVVIHNLEWSEEIKKLLGSSRQPSVRFYEGIPPNGWLRHKFQADLDEAHWWNHHI